MFLESDRDLKFGIKFKTTFEISHLNLFIGVIDRGNTINYLSRVSKQD